MKKSVNRPPQSATQSTVYLQYGFTQYGFTLVELVIVMLVMSVLAVTAYGRVSQLDTQARQASLQSFKATILSVAAMARGVCMSDPGCAGHPTGQAFTTIDGNTIYFTQGYPVGWQSDNSGNLHQLIDAARFTLQPTLSSTSRAIYTLDGARDESRCKLEYAISGNEQTSATGSLSVTIDGSGC